MTFEPRPCHAVCGDRNLCCQCYPNYWKKSQTRHPLFAALKITGGIVAVFRGNLVLSLAELIQFSGSTRLHALISSQLGILGWWDN